MKKIYFLFVATIFGSGVFAQCVINPSLFGAANNTNYSIIPDTITNLPLVYVGTGYTTDLQFHIQPDTVTSLGTFPITQVHIDSVSGMPANFSYLPNPSNGTFTTPTNSPPGTGYGCVAVTGLAAAGQENGGPNLDGIYPLIVYYTGTVVVFNVPTPMPASKTGYKLHIMPANGVNNSLSAGVFSVTPSLPNPADAHAEFILNAPVNGEFQFTMYNILGSIVKQENVVATKGSNHFTLETSALTAGVYMCSFRLGDAVVTRRITISH
ncbi:MAG TPA: T9SS type A sorting domain-containing protein [Bacteroidia bacterium]|nr:T9SS type A sorting domain-containing protein [Bacteroidia bacterium]